MEPAQVLGHMASGALAGVAVEAALYPLDTIKTRIQAARGGASVNWTKHLYRGLGGNLAGVVPAAAVFFAVYEPTKQFLLPMTGEGTGRSAAGAHIAAATSAGLASSLIRVPTEVIKTRMQTGQFAGLSARGALWHIATREGITGGLFAGFGSFLLRDVPFDAIEFASYEQLKLSWRSVSGGRELRQHETAIIGAFAGMLTGAFTTPLDVVKTRLMTQPAAQSAGDVVGEKVLGAATAGLSGQPLRRYTGVVDCVVRMVAEEGWGSLLKGIGPRVTWIGVGGGIFFFTLESAQRVLVPASRVTP